MAISSPEPRRTHTIPSSGGQTSRGKLIITGQRPLSGVVKVESAKNAILPIMAAGLLIPGPVVLEDVPPLDDVKTMCALLEALGARVRREGGRVVIDSSVLATEVAPFELVRRMRASFLTIGPLAARLGRARLGLPGGCAIGNRPVDLHLKGLAALGASVSCAHGEVEVEAGRFQGGKIYLDFPSVTATETIMMAAALAAGSTVIENAAQEPEVTDLANFLNSAGARITGAGTDTIRIEGVERLHPPRAGYKAIPDRIEAGTYCIAAAITGGDVLVKDALSSHLKPLMAKLEEAGAVVREEEDGLRVCGPERARATDVKTLPYPGFPTDLQAPMMSLLAVADGASIVTETVFENRFQHVDELKRMGADIVIQGRSAIVRGVPRLTGAPVAATDLRAGAALVLAGLVADGRTEVQGLEHIARGYHRLAEKLLSLGAEIVEVGDLT